MAGPGDILIKVGAETAKAVSNLDNVHKALDKTASTSSRMASGLKAAALPAAAALTALSAAAVKWTQAAMEDQAVAERLATSLKSTTGATDAQVAAMQDYIDKTELATGVSDDQLSPALATLARATGDTAEAQKMMSVALDVSAATGKDVESVSKAMAKAHEGQTGALAKLVPGLSEAARTSKDYDVIMAELADTTGGAMTASTKTAAGQLRIFKAATDQLNEAMGAVLLPILQAILPLLTRLAIFAQDNVKVIQILAGVVAVLSAGILVANVAMKAFQAIQIAVKVATAAWTAAQWLLNAALSANPIGLVVVAIAALAAGLIYAYKHSETFRSIVQAAFRAVADAAAYLRQGFDALVAAARVAFDWIVAHWQVAAFAFGPLGAAIALIADNWDKVAGAARAAADVMLGAIRAVEGAISSVIGAVERLIGALGRIHVPDIHLPSIPGLNAAAFAGGPAVAGFASSSSSSGGSTTINVYGAIDPEGTARTIRRVLAEHDRRMGRSA
jgi:hypothetical protein